MTRANIVLSRDNREAYPGDQPLINHIGHHRAIVDSGRRRDNFKIAGGSVS